MFTVTAYNNPHLHVDQSALQVVLSLKVDDNIAVAPTPLALALALDCSGSMDGTKMRAAREGAIKVLQALDASMLFMVVTFNDNAHVLFGPAAGVKENKKRAIAAIQSVYGSKGTRMSSALNSIVDKVGNNQDRARKILFLTDGKNEGEQRHALDLAVARCMEANISISAWGIGTDWDADELLHMADATRGSADIIPTANQIEAAFSASFSEMRRTVITNARLQLWTPVGVKIAAIQQVYPSIAAFGMEPDPANPRQKIVALGSFAAGDQRDYLLDLEMQANPVGQQFMILRPSLKYQAGGSEQEEKSARSGWVFVQWTEDTALASQYEQHIAHYTNQEELSRNIQEGQAALAVGDNEKATRLLARALEISERTGNARVTRLLNDMLQRDDKGTLSLNKQADAVVSKTLAINVSKTSKLK